MLEQPAKPSGHFCGVPLISDAWVHSNSFPRYVTIYSTPSLALIPLYSI